MLDADYAVVLLTQNSPIKVESKRQRTNWLSLGQTEARTEEDVLKKRKQKKVKKKERKKERKERQQT